MEVDDMIQEVLRGSLGASRWPAPKVVKIFVASTRNDFLEERRQLLEVLGPELQSEYDHTGIEVELVDMHYGTGYDPSLDPYLFADHLDEITECRRISKGCFFICLVGDEYLPRPLPSTLSEEFMSAAVEAAATAKDGEQPSNAKDLLSSWYVPTKDEEGTLVHRLRRPNPEPSDEAAREWTAIKESMEDVLVEVAEGLVEKAEEERDSKTANAIRQTYIYSAIERQFSRALSVSPSATKPGILAVVRDLEKAPPSSAPEEDSQQHRRTSHHRTTTKALLKSFRDRIGASLPSENRLYLTAPWKEGGIDPEAEEHELYLYRFRCSVKEHLRVMISKALDEEPDMKAKNKTIMEVFEEAACHLASCRDHIKQSENKWKSSPELENLRATLVGAADAGTSVRHAPILIYGPPGSGKSSLLSSVAQAAEEWFAEDGSRPQPHRQLLKVIRFCGSTPRSAYSLEVLRLLCQHLAILLHTEFLPKDASFDPLYLNTWFQSLLRRAETAAQCQPQWPPPLLLVLVDDLHGLQPTESDIVAALSWLPVSLPHNVLLVATSSLHPDALKLTPLQKERLSAPESLFALKGHAPLRTRLLTFLDTVKRKTLGDVEYPEGTEGEGESLEKLAVACLAALEHLVCRPAVARLCSLLSTTQFGLTETEILELTMPTNRVEDEPLRLDNACFTFASLCTVRRSMALLLQEKVQSGRIVIGWRHHLVSQVSVQRYLSTAESQYNLHSELATLFFQEDDDEDEEDEEEEEEKKEREDQEEGDEDGKRKQMPFQATAAPDVTYSTRHVEESWIHLLKAGDADKLKRLTVCNFDFLLATVQTASISYLRCVLEHARCYQLDRDLELVYGAVRKSSDVLSRDPLQLASQIICWLRSVAEGSGDLVGAMIMSAMAWCDGYSEPLLVPLNGWLQPPLPLQIKSVQLPSPVHLMEASPTGQHVVVVSWSSPNEPQLWSTPSCTLIHSFRPGHSGPVACLCICPFINAKPPCPTDTTPTPPTSAPYSVSAIVPDAQYLITGSEDTSVMVWDLATCRLKLRIMEHIAPVLCVASALGNTVVASGGEDSRVILTSLITGDVIMKIDHHRGPVTAVAVNSSDDVLVSGSSDSTVCIWSLDDFVLLNTIQLPSPVSRLCISPNSSFLLAATDLHRLCLRSLATGSQIHYLKGLKADVCSLSIARDSQRAAVGSSDGRVYVFDMLGGCLSRTLSSHPASPVTGVCPTAHDDFLLSAGGNKISVWSFRPRDGLPNIGTPLGVFSGARAGLGGVAALETDNQGARVVKAAMAAQRPHDAPITCVDISRDGTMAVTGSVDCLVNVWSVRTTPEVHCTLEGHTAPVSAVAFAPSGLFAVSGSEDRTARVWGLTLGLQVSCFRRHGSSAYREIRSEEDFYRKTSVGSLVWRNDWQLELNTDKCMTGHGSTITSVAVMMDSRRVATSDRNGMLMVWAADSGAPLSSLTGALPGAGGASAPGAAPSTPSGAASRLQLAVTSDMRYAVSGSGDNSLRIWKLTREKEERDLNVSHSEEITCFVLTADSRHVITGSKDSSLKVWQVAGGKLAQVLVGHSDHVTCVAVSIQPPPALTTNDNRNGTRPSGALASGKGLPVATPALGEKVAPPEAPPPVLVVSGARDASLIVWDMATGADLRTLSGHLAFISCVAVAADGTIAVSGSEDKSVMVWDTRRGLPLSSLSMHAPILGLCMSTDASRIVLHLQDCAAVPVACLHNTPATYVKLPAYVQPAKEIEDLRPSAPKRPIRRLLKKEVSLDTYTWQKKYGHLTSSAMVAAVEERLKRRFSVSASMEEISKIPGSTLGSQVLGPEQAALAQSQHFEHLQALWNKRSPPRRRQNPGLSKQNSCSSRRDSADPEDNGMEEEDEEEMVEEEEEEEGGGKRPARGIPQGGSGVCV